MCLAPNARLNLQYVHGDKLDAHQYIHTDKLAPGVAFSSISRITVKKKVSTSMILQRYGGGGYMIGKAANKTISVREMSRLRHKVEFRLGYLFNPS